MEAARTDVQRDTKESFAMNCVQKDTSDWTVCTNVVPTVVEMNPAIVSLEFVMKVVRTDGVVLFVEQTSQLTILISSSVYPVD